jgi:signal transduction histidine kinase
VRGEFVCRRCQLPGTAEDPERSSGVVGVLVDITAQRQAQVLAEKARDEALEASRLKSEFLASVSHEIRTPMNGVIGVAELLAGTQLDDEQREYLRAIQDSAQALLVVINDILDFARIEAGRVATISEPFDICAVVDGVVDILTPRARQKGLELLVFVDPQLPRTLVGDGGRIRQVLLNLVGNAVKFTEQGHVAIDVVPVGAIANRYGVRFTVADTGPGIEQGARHRLFQPFSQVDASNGRRHGGTGLGLSISKHLVEAMGGDIGFAPRDGGGAVFAFEVPLEPGSEAASSEATLHVRTGTIIGIHTDSALRFEHLARWVQSLGAVPMRLGDPGIQPPNTLEPRVMLVVDAAPTTLSALIERWPRALQVVVSTTRNDSIPSDIMRIPWPLRGRSLATVLERMA